MKLKTNLKSGGITANHNESFKGRAATKAETRLSPDSVVRQSARRRQPDTSLPSIRETLVHDTGLKVNTRLRAGQTKFYDLP